LEFGFRLDGARRRCERIAERDVVGEGRSEQRGYSHGNHWAEKAYALPCASRRLVVGMQKARQARAIDIDGAGIRIGRVGAAGGRGPELRRGRQFWRGRAVLGPERPQGCGEPLEMLVVWVEMSVSIVRLVLSFGVLLVLLFVLLVLLFVLLVLLLVLRLVACC